MKPLPRLSNSALLLNEALISQVPTVWATDSKDFDYFLFSITSLILRSAWGQAADYTPQGIGHYTVVTVTIIVTLAGTVQCMHVCT